LAVENPGSKRRAKIWFSFSLRLGRDEASLDGAMAHRIAVDADPLMHLIRNSMDHGIGTPEERAARASLRQLRFIWRRGTRAPMSWSP